MNWQDIKTAPDNTHFIFQGKQVFSGHFIEVLKFHAPGLAPVKDETGAYHIDTSGSPIYSDRYSRTFGYYFNRAAVVEDNKWFHLNEKGEKAYNRVFSWTGNYQENVCPVRDSANRYFHIDTNGENLYAQSYVYCGDYKDGYACVKTDNGLYRHIDIKGYYLNDKEFLDLGIFHKNFAVAKDERGWHHIDRSGDAIYADRFSAVEPFYNGYALVTLFDNQKIIIDESGNKSLTLA